MITIKEQSNYWKFEVTNDDGYPDWIKKLHLLCVPTKESATELADEIKNEIGVDVNFIKFSNT